MKKIKIYSEIAFFLGILLLSVGMNFIIKANFGISVVQSSAYILSLAFPQLSFGTYSYLVQLLLVAMLCVIIMKFNLRYVFSFVSAVFYGYTLDLFIFLMRNLSADTIPIRIIFFIIGFFLIVIGVTMFFRTNIPLMPYDIFVTDLARSKNWSVNTVKIIFDLSCLASGIILSLVFFKRLVGIGYGTIITGLFSGICIKYVGRAVDKIIVFEPLFKSRNR